MNTQVVQGELFPQENPPPAPWALTPAQIRAGHAGIKACRAALREALEASGHTTAA